MANYPSLNTVLEQIDKLVFQRCDVTLSNLKAELESQEYAAQNFDLESQCVKFRVAKITPTKIGQFVTLWHRNIAGITAPFEVDDPIDMYIIATQKDHNLGLFIFPKTVLFQKGILSHNGKGGKRGFRVYPIWDITINKQAQQTQAWQKLYFLDLTDHESVDLQRAIKLLTS
ncbi:MepB family protein [Sphingobacterium sp. SRCM116780]|uniref:MepB family protein n=1 Tax=Sphingobacterium sp. SRCM116780 TaxID=2907623 RepID=UPI001F4487FB|nr:MepB family protein [Sphingobacterium sp. SRCM116780]UIR57498.1 MepB family protein [Sphingobacterium sp. SRCM116780]